MLRLKQKRDTKNRDKINKVNEDDIVLSSMP